MKKFQLFAFALAAGLMMGCSDEVGNDVNPGGTGSATVGEGFMSVAINLPSTNGSRASVSGFDDGLPAEYAVKNGKLIILVETARQLQLTRLLMIWPTSQLLSKLMVPQLTRLRLQQLLP